MHSDCVHQNMPTRLWQYAYLHFHFSDTRLLLHFGGLAQEKACEMSHTFICVFCALMTMQSCCTAFNRHN